MKKTLRIMGLCALAALTIASCKKNEQKADMTTFQATLTQPTGEGRTHIGDGNWLMWDNNDAIKVFTADGTSAVFTTHNANSTTATFNGNIAEADAYCAFYPAAKASGLINGKVVLTLANEQQYAEGGFANGTYPMAAYTTGTIFDFHSPCGLLAIPMQGTGTITSIELTGKLNEPLAGQLLIDPVGFDPENPTFTLGDFQTTVTLNCGSGVTLEENNAKTFYFVVPKNVFMQGFTAVVKNGGTEIYRLETTNNNVIAAECIRLMPTVNVASLGVMTNAATEVGYTTATLNGAYTAPSGMNVTEVGFYWGDATAMNNKVTATTGNPFTYDLTELEEGHTYAYQAYAKNGESELLGTVVEFTTDVQIIITAPTVTTAEVTEITTTTATVGGTITDAGNGTITESGICYKTGDEDWTCVALAATENAFSTTLTELTPNTTYIVRAYATNEEGTGYGEEKSFTTEEEIVITVPTVTTNEVTEITATSAIVGGQITDAGNGTISESGICYKTGEEEWTCVALTATNNAFSTALEGLTPNTAYTVRAYATNEEGTGYGEEVTFTTLNEGGGDEHEYVDLGLPSGTLWATCNVGADTPEGYGDYFAWGETQPKDVYTWSTYQYCMGSWNSMTKYCTNSDYGYNGFTDNLTTLLPEDDAAAANWGNGWRMPTKEEFEELCNNTTVTWTQQNGVKGRLFTASNGNSLFLPAAGSRWGGGLDLAGDRGHYWSSSLATGGPYYAWYFYFSSDFTYVYSYNRYGGQSVRAVREN